MISISEISFHIFIEDEGISSEKVRNDEKPQEIIKNRKQLQEILEIIEKTRNSIKIIEIN
jgi:hypothetical protein